MDKDAWQPDALYIQFFSIKGCIFNLISMFVDEVQMRENRKKMKDGSGTARDLRGKNQAEI